MYVPASVRRSSARRISALDSPSIRRTRFQNSKAKPRFPKQNRDFRGQDGLVARGFDDITRFFTKHKISIPAPTLASPPNQTRKQCSAPPTHQRMHRHRPPGSSRDLTAGDAHPGVPCRSSHCSPAPPGGPVRAGGEPLDSRESARPAPLSSAELLSPWFPTLLLPPTTPWPYYGPTVRG